ncbi:hypothetical protein H072_8101 [Dactylellina haptotyla CBS 200.50]|uniref:Glycosyl transferase CAP10 domain-containing protein n=1 Tax=Dactylellina haptotyla (strain CBS 200.50) TaxID=1284197 RepID=S8BSJ5_DACHA|nr:hypothetical protein H072_8101 [Dactylellina haptotyla CBS 200.50]
MSTIGRLQRYVGALRPPIRITISSPTDNDYQELKADSVFSRSPSPRSSSDDYPPFLPSPVSRTGSNDFQDNSDLVWLKLKIRNRTIFGIAYPRILPRTTSKWGQKFSSQYNQRKRRCTRRQCIIFAVMLVLMAVCIPIGVIHHKRKSKQTGPNHGWGWGLPGMDENGWPIWEFTFEHMKFNYGGIKELVPKTDNVPEFPYTTAVTGKPTSISYSTTFASPTPIVFAPYPDRELEAQSGEYEGEYVACHGFDGKLLDASNPPSKVYKGIPWQRADEVLGSSELLGLDNTVCFEREALLTPYGFGDNSTAELKEDWKNVTSLDFSNVNWGKLQEECVFRNRGRFNPSPTTASGYVPPWVSPTGSPKPKKVKAKPEDEKAEKEKTEKEARDISGGPRYRHRTAVVLRSWDTFRFNPDDIINLRRLITELTLFSGGEYAVHVLVDVKDFNIPIWTDEQTYQETVEKVVPKEFRGIVELSNEPMMAANYWGAEWHDSYKSLFMPLQIFSRKHPEYDFIWQWEMDMRLIGHHYHFLENLAKWAKKQPRRELWERSTRHYIPALHGTWENYSNWVSSLYPETNSTIWGPILPERVLPIEPPKPPTEIPEDDNYEWGVGEEADLITLLPMFDPINGTWSLKDECVGYEEDIDVLPRRSAIVTASRLSKGLLWRMHEENAKRRHTCASEMWPATTCLHHGLKAVYAPHPIWFEKDWQNMTYVDGVFNGGTKGSAVKESVYGAMEHNFSGTTWFYNSRWARMLYRRWLGYDDNGGGREADAEHGNICLNGVLLHPVKEVTPANEH